MAPTRVTFTLVDGSVKVNTADDVSRIPLLLLMLLLLLPLLGANELIGEINRKMAKHFMRSWRRCKMRLSFVV
jgi:hypothetical protein